MCIFLRSIWENFLADRNVCTDTTYRACDKYQVWPLLQDWIGTLFNQAPKNQQQTPFYSHKIPLPSLLLLKALKFIQFCGFWNSPLRWSGPPHWGPQCRHGIWTWRIFEYDDPSKVENTKHLSLHLRSCLKAMPSMKMEILREFLESSTIHGLAYIPSSKVKPISI